MAGQQPKYETLAGPAPAVGGALAQQLTQAGVAVQQVQPKQQAADVRLSTDAVAFAKQHTAAGCLVVVTNDTGEWSPRHVQQHPARH
jgi:hypothetical protein